MPTIPCPYDHVTIRWTGLDPAAREDHAHRLIGCSAPDRLRESEHFAALIDAAVGGDMTAFAWLAHEFRPAFLVVGARLRRIDRFEWAGVALEALHRELRCLDAVDPRWQRRRLHQRVLMRMRRATVRAGRERDHQIRLQADLAVSTGTSPLDDIDLRMELDRLLAEVDSAVAEGLVAVAEGGTLGPVADAHGIAVETLRKRMSRARPYLRSELSAWCDR